MRIFFSAILSLIFISAIYIPIASAYHCKRSLAVGRDSDGFVYHGWSDCWKSTQKSRNQAIATCDRGSCRVIATFHYGCYSLAWNYSGAWAGAHGDDEYQAKAKALRSCKKVGRDCKIKSTICIKHKAPLM